MSYVPEDKKLINFNTLAAFTGGSREFSHQLVDALLSELLIFEDHIKAPLTENEFLSFRKAYHSISPSLQMLEISELINAVENFKISYTKDPASIATHAKNIHHLVQLVKEEITKWRTT